MFNKKEYMKKWRDKHKKETKEYNKKYFERCWALKNLRLLPAKENFAKKDKLEKPFQPSLMINGI